MISFELYATNDDEYKTEWYVGGQFGSVDTSTKSDLFSQNTISYSYGFYGGYNYTSWFGLEGGAFFSGNIADNRTDLDSATYQIFYFTPKFSYWFNDLFSIYAKTGIARIDYDEIYSGIVFGNAITIERSWEGVGTSLGLGVQYNIFKGLTVRCGIDQIKGDLSEVKIFGANPKVKSELTNVTLGIHYQF